jgi:hypothetical protein
MAEIKLNINWDDLHKQIGKLVSSGAGMATGAAGAAGGGGGANVASRLGAGLLGPAGSRTETIGKGLGQISKQLPGVGMFGDMAKAFTTGGLIGVGMAGIAGIMSFVKQIMESSKVFQGIAGSFFKIFGAMADLFLLPFLPIAMKGMQMLMQYIPNFGRWGQKAATGIENVIKTFQDRGFFGGLKKYIGIAWDWIKTTAYPLVTEKIIPLIDQAGIDIGKEILKQAFGIGKDPDVYHEEMLEEGERNVRPEYSPTGNKFGGGGKKYREAMEREYGRQWSSERDRNPDYIGEMALGGLVPGMSGSGPSGFGGATTNHAGILSEIYEGILEFESGINAEIQEVSKTTGNFTAKSQQTINNVGSGFLNTVDRSLAATGENIGQLNTVANDVTKTLTDTIAVTQANTRAVMTASSIHIGEIVEEIDQLRVDAETVKAAILEKQINFRKASSMWMEQGDEQGGLSSEELKKIDVQLQARIIDQDAIEEARRVEIQRLMLLAEARMLEKRKREREEAEQREQEAADALAAAKAKEFYENTLTASPMFQSFARMKNKLKSLQNRLASQESATAGLYANAQAARDGMNAYAYSDKEADKYLISRRKQQYWSSVVMPAQDTAQRHSETMSQTRQDIRNVENWIRTKHIPAVYSNIYGRIYENQGNIAEHQRSNLNYDAGGIVSGDIGEPQLIWAQGGEQISPIGMPKNGGGGNTSNRVLNISIQTKSSVKDILIDLANLKTLDNASLFNSVW